jgi:transcriptional regulator with XRE-family HTH domain
MSYAGDSVTGIDMKVVRVRLGMTQRQLAEALGISPSQIANYERGFTRGADRRPAPIPRAIELACEMLLIKRERGEI